MLVERTTGLPIPARLTLDGLTAIHPRELAEIATMATSSGEALLERSGLGRLDQVSQCHFGVQLGRPLDRDSLITMQLRWWNDRARSLTPGFIGELRVHDLGNDESELSVCGEYHPRAHLYELVDRAFLNRMAKAVVSAFLTRLKAKVMETVAINAA